MKKKVTVSAVIPVYNCEDYIKKNIESIINQTYPIKEIIIVNDGSEDRTKEVIKEVLKKHKSKHKIMFIDLPTNMGQAVARNVGYRKATGDIIFFVEADAVFDKDYLEKIVARMIKDVEKNGKITYAGGIGRQQPLDYDEKNILLRWVKDNFDLIPKIRDPLNVWVYWKSVLDEVNAFDENMKKVVEDVDLGERVKARGYKMFFEPSVCYHHKHPRKLIQFIKKNIYNGSYALPFYIKHWKKPFHYKNTLFHLCWYLSMVFLYFSVWPFTVLSLIYAYFYVKQVMRFRKVDKNWRVFLFPFINSIRSTSTLIGIMVYVFGLIKKKKKKRNDSINPMKTKKE